MHPNLFFQQAYAFTSQPWDAPDPLPVMRREMKLMLIEIGELRTEVEQLRNVKEFLYRVIESRDQWQREAQVDGESAALATILRALSWRPQGVARGV